MAHDIWAVRLADGFVPSARKARGGRKGKRHKEEMESPRDARRRRILDRGSDRLAFILGQTQSLPDSRPPSKPEEQLRASAAVDPPFDDNTTGVASQGRAEDVCDLSKEPKSERSNEISKPSVFDEMHSSENRDDDIKFKTEKEMAFQEHQSQNQPEIVDTATLVAQGPTDRHVDMATSSILEKKQGIFSLRRISHSISTSENIRLIFAVFISLLVILLQKGYVFGGGFLGSIFNFRPLFLVLLTDVTIVVGQLMVTEGTDKETKVEKKAKKEEHDLADNIGKTLEVLLVLQKGLKAFFMDCSICAAITICGLGI